MMVTQDGNTIRMEHTWIGRKRSVFTEVFHVNPSTGNRSRISMFTTSLGEFSAECAKMMEVIKEAHEALEEERSNVAPLPLAKDCGG